jgi:hypothetical protein
VSWYASLKRSELACKSEEVHYSKWDSIWDSGAVTAFCLSLEQRDEKLTVGSAFDGWCCLCTVWFKATNVDAFKDIGATFNDHGAVGMNFKDWIRSHGLGIQFAFDVFVKDINLVSRLVVMRGATGIFSLKTSIDLELLAGSNGMNVSNIVDGEQHISLVDERTGSTTKRAIGRSE